MDKIAALYLAHLNPFTKAHEEIINRLKKKYTVYIFPVRFLLNGKEINTRSFPFSYELRKLMIREVFPNDNNIIISPNYTFYSPFIKYFPPIFSPYSWKIREQVVNTISEKKFISYTGDPVERYALRVYRFNPIKAKRLPISASHIKELIYKEATGVRSRNKNTARNKNTESRKRENLNEREMWEDKVPTRVVKIIKENWSVIDKYATAQDETIKIFGVKFPRRGFF